MHLTRRRFVQAGVSGIALLGGTLLFAGCATEEQPAPAQAQPMPRMRLEDFVQDSKRVDALKRGVEVMKARQPSDPTSWFF